MGFPPPLIHYAVQESAEQRNASPISPQELNLRQLHHRNFQFRGKLDEQWQRARARNEAMALWLSLHELLRLKSPGKVSQEQSGQLKPPSAVRYSAELRRCSKEIVGMFVTCVTNQCMWRQGEASSSVPALQMFVTKPA